MEKLKKFYINDECVTPYSNETMPVLIPETGKQTGTTAFESRRGA